jgi:hypothetical protein
VSDHAHPPQEPDDPSAGWIAGLGIGTVVLAIVLSLIAVALVDRYGNEYAGPLYPRPLADPRPDRPVSFPLEFYALEHGTPAEGERLEQIGRAKLESWGWVDRAAGTVHMPIDLAMDVVSAQETP